jgi:GT2 family glycosyltransferase
LVFLDDDAAAQPDWLAQLLQPYQDERVAGVGGAILPVWQSGQPAWFPDEFLWVVGCTYRGVPTHPAQVRNLIGANMSFRRQVFSAAGLFLNDMGRLGALPMGCEETELCLRAARAMPETGFIYQPAAVVRHHVPAARATWRYFFARCFAEGRSKAQVARLAGGRRGLESERRYTLYTLPRGVLLGLYRALRHGEASGLGRAFAIAAGLALTTAGFISGTASVGRRALPSATVKPQGERI